MADTSVAVSIAAFTLIITYLGLHLSLHPAQTLLAKRNYKLGLVVCSIAIIILTAFQTHRNNASQQALSTELEEIRRSALIANVPSTANPTAPSVVLPRQIPQKRAPERQPLAINQSSTGDCSPNIAGNNNSTTCAPQAKLIATKQLQQKTPNGEWLTSFSVSSNVLIRTGDLKLLCDGPVSRAAISRINPVSFISGNNGPNPADPDEVIYELGPEMLSPGMVVVVGVYSAAPVRVLSGSLGNMVIVLGK